MHFVFVSTGSEAVPFCGNFTVDSDFSTKLRVLSLNRWKLGPRGDGALEVRQWSVCLFESKKKERNTQYNVWQSLPYTAQDRDESVTGGARMHHSPSKVIMESRISSSLTGDTHVIHLDPWQLSAGEPNLRHYTSLHRFFLVGWLNILLFGNNKSVKISGLPLLWVYLNMLDFNRSFVSSDTWFTCSLNREWIMGE